MSNTDHESCPRCGQCVQDVPADRANYYGVRGGYIAVSGPGPALVPSTEFPDPDLPAAPADTVVKRLCVACDRAAQVALNGDAAVEWHGIPVHLRQVLNRSIMSGPFWSRERAGRLSHWLRRGDHEHLDHVAAYLNLAAGGWAARPHRDMIDCIGGRTCGTRGPVCLLCLLEDVHAGAGVSSGTALNLAKLIAMHHAGGVGTYTTVAARDLARRAGDLVARTRRSETAP